MRRAVLLILAVFLLIALPFAAAQESINDDVVQAPDAAQTPDAVTESEVQDSEADITEVTPVIHTEPEQSAIAETPAVETHPLNFSTRLGIALGIIAGQILLIWLIWQLFKRLSQKVSLSAGDRIKPLVIKKLKLLSTKQIIDAIIFCLRILKYLVTALLLFITLPIVFSLFPATRSLATTLFGYILHPLRDIAVGIVRYITQPD